MDTGYVPLVDPEPLSPCSCESPRGPGIQHVVPNSGNRSKSGKAEKLKKDAFQLRAVLWPYLQKAGCVCKKQRPS